MVKPTRAEKKLHNGAANNKRDQMAMLRRVDELLATPVYIDETMVAEIVSFFL